ncbi:L-ribulose-5-phosphate 3-epimerase [Erysipelothrix sp. Poltava]|nr:L-ribulose-5-phosphate 3-epimerase [Erysipelothrix sp. Poltava]
MMTALGIYEKALPPNLSWVEKFELAKKLGFSYIELSIDESDARLDRLDWDKKTLREISDAMDKTDIRIQSLCLSAHRRYPLGSLDAKTRHHALIILKKAVKIASMLGIRTIQLAGYDVYYEEKSELTREYFISNLKKCVEIAASKQVMLAIEIMDDPFINSITKYNAIKSQIPSPWLQVYPDIGNLSAWPGNDVGQEFEQNIAAIAAIHIKDVVKVSPQTTGVFKNVRFGEGDVNFLA